jgi:hypothetical protein
VTVNADIQNKLLKGDLAERKMLLSALPRLTLMLYELSRTDDGESFDQQAAKLHNAAERFLDMAYDGLDHQNLAKLNYRAAHARLRRHPSCHAQNAGSRISSESPLPRMGAPFV